MLPCFFYEITHYPLLPHEKDSYRLQLDHRRHTDGMPAIVQLKIGLLNRSDQ
jgi:hypothetical protein